MMMMDDEEGKKERKTEDQRETPKVQDLQCLGKAKDSVQHHPYSSQ
jgi:hypothetical protein